MNLIDSHVHLDVFDERGEVEELLTKAREQGVFRMVAIGGSPEANRRALRLSRKHPETLSAVVGFDRDLAAETPDATELDRLIRDPLVVGVGESGLDYHYEPETRSLQVELFDRMLECAAKVGKPMVVHSRDAEEDTLAALRLLASTWPGDVGRMGVLHCFTGSYAFAARLLDLGMMISFSGILSFKNAEDLRETAAKLPLDRLLIETDAPYLAPVPFRGKENHPAWVYRVAEILAELHHCLPEAVADQTRRNAERLFSLSAQGPD